VNWEQWLETNKYDTNTIDLMKQAYVAGLQTAYDALYSNENGDYEFVMQQLKTLIEKTNEKD
jgi:hypothetical protein